VQAGTKSYSLKFVYPVKEAYAMHDAIMQAQNSQKSVSLLHLLNRVTMY
jgi:hypothetical protein